MDFGKLLTIIVACLCCAHAANEQCIEGRYHKESPSTETDEYKVCTPWKSLTCCTPQFDNELDKNEARNLYNHSWHRCGNLSKECLRFWKRQECFYQCSPFAYKWQHINVSEAIEGVPICASECDDWFEACKNDSICVENVLTDYNFTMFGENLCPVDAMCKNYSEMYGNGKGLCEKMWGSSYKYTEQNANKDNCMVFWFTPGTENPNRRVQKEGTGSASRNAFSAMFLLVIQVYGLSF